MTKEEFDLAKATSNKIDKKEQDFSTINRLLGSCGLSAYIDGTPKNQFRKALGHICYDKELIKKVLESERDKITNELTELKKQFEDIKTAYQNKKETLNNS